MWWRKTLELFVDESGLASMSRLLLFLSFFVASWILVVDTYANKAANEGLYGIFIGAYALSYVGGKFADRKAPSPVIMPSSPVVVQTGPQNGAGNVDNS